MRKIKSEKKVVVAMSGGLDSSVAAALLKRNGFEVVGIFMKFWSPSLGKQGNRCCSPEAEIRARKVAKMLKIPFYVCNFEKEFKKRIVDYFLKEYRAGKTPNPCVVCNKEIKFGLLLEKALQFNADFVATGHYSRLKKDKNGFHLLAARDKNKDQSYFLWKLNQRQLGQILFPIGNYTRKEVENLAKKFKLPVLGIKKSVEVCFIQTTMVDEALPHLPPRPAQLARQGSVNDFLSRYIKPKPGLILTPDGKKIGQHDGLPFYTIGQRKGIKLPGGPFYVLDKDLKKNLLIVTKNEKDLYKKELICKNVNWISPKQSLRDATGQAGKEPRLRQGFGLRPTKSPSADEVGGQAKLPFKIKAKIRYRTQLTPATIAKKLKAKSYKLIFDKPQRAITPGQSAVFYKGEELLGGGIIC